MIIDIMPILVVVFHSLTSLIGLDFVWCGYWYNNNHDLRYLPRLLGYLVLKIFEVGNRKNRSTNQLANNMFNMEAAGKYLFFGGIFLVAKGLFPLLYMLIQSISIK
jgi:hypothetical protein